jgi:polysaccharide export outer membrane protein
MTDACILPPKKPPAGSRLVAWGLALVCLVATATAHGLELKLSRTLKALPAATDTRAPSAPSASRPTVAGPGSAQASGATAARPASLAPAAPERELPLGVGDQITISVFGQPDLSAEVTVGESGAIMVPLIGTISVLDRSAGELEQLIASRLQEGGYLKNPGVSVQIRQLRSQLVSVMGEVQRPGRYPIQGRMTVLDALASAGGLTPRADRTILLLRKPEIGKIGQETAQEIPILLDDPTGRTRGQLDVALTHNDVVFVGLQKLFYVHGEVRRPGAYPVEPGMNIMKALALSGGVTERGSVRRIKVHRMDASKMLQEIRVDPSFALQPDDVVHVDERLF